MLDPRATHFWHAVIRSGLMDEGGLSACWEAIEPSKRDDPDQSERRLARQAVRSGRLTLWQAQQLLAGRTTGYMVDRYRLLQLIGQGGMGRVYLAKDTRLERPVALKILAPDRLDNPRALARFEREARMGARLQHENLVRIYDFGDSNGRFYLVMEYIEGKTIGTLIDERGPLPTATAVRLVRQVARGLHHAHSRGLIHRDVNPYNILVTRDGTAKLADLGLAVALAEEQERVTRDGATIGTFDYVAPEQAKNSRSADARSDIYSLGCSLYHMCTGRVPFPGPTLPEKILGHQTLEPTPITRLVPSIPEGLAEVVRRMMSKSPEGRYAAAIDVAHALGPYQDIPAPVAVRAGSPSVASYASAPGSAAAARLATPPDPALYAADPAAPLLTPDDDFDHPADEIALIPDTEPTSSEGPPSWADDRSSPGLAAAVAGWLTPARLWGLVILAVAVAALLLILATAGSRSGTV